MAGLYFWSLAIALAAIPGWAVARMALDRPLYVRALMFAGTALYVLPVALVLSALVLFQAFGIDILD